MLKLYYHPLSTYSQKVTLALYESGMEVEKHIVNLMDEKEIADYRKIYPIGKIPLLILEDGHPVPESSIIVEYINSVHPEAGLIPPDPLESRKTRFLDRMYDLYFNSQVGNMFWEQRKPKEQQNQSVIDSATDKIRVMYNNMENNLANKTWNRGDTFTMADCAAGPPLFYAQNLIPFDDKPNVMKFWKRFQERPSYQKVMSEAKPFLDAMAA